DDSVLISGLKTSTVYKFRVKAEDEHGQSSISSLYQAKVSGLCDYNGDNKIDAFDLGRYVKSWTDRNYLEADIYPYSGSLPFVVVIGDGKLDINDVFTFTKMWDYSHIRGLPKIVSYDINGFRGEVLNLDECIVFRPENRGKFVSYGFEIYYFGAKVDSFVVLRDGVSLVYNDSINGVIYFDFSKIDGIEEMGDELFKIKLSKMGDRDSVVIKFYAYDVNSLEVGSYSYERVYVYRFADLPDEFELYQNYPNPFNPVTYIKFDLPSQSYVRISVYDVAGRLVKNLVDGEVKAGRHVVRFEADDLASGVYFYRIVASNLKGDRFIKTRKMVILK
ncbi:MAG: T9SS type A sorting domain-containing protein, partial [Candidatus Kryptonium sp.]